MAFSDLHEGILEIFVDSQDVPLPLGPIDFADGAGMRRFQGRRRWTKEAKARKAPEPKPRKARGPKPVKLGRRGGCPLCRSNALNHKCAVTTPPPVFEVPAGKPTKAKREHRRITWVADACPDCGSLGIRHRCAATGRLRSSEYYGASG